MKRCGDQLNKTIRRIGFALLVVVGVLLWRWDRVPTTGSLVGISGKESFGAGVDKASRDLTRPDVFQPSNSIIKAVEDEKLPLPALAEFSNWVEAYLAAPAPTFPILRRTRDEHRFDRHAPP